MRDSIIIKFLYKTVVGRVILKFLVNPSVSRASACFLTSSSSRWLVPIFVKRNQINMTYYIIPKGGYHSFNDFFTRKMKEKYVWYQNGELVSPCDGLLTVSKIDEKTLFYIKNTEYSLQELLNDKAIADEYRGGTAFVFRLTPAHYHRYIWATTGFLGENKRIEGVLHSVQPVCHEKKKVYVQNTREYVMIRHPKLGDVIQMEIGALLVGKISNHKYPEDRSVYAGAEKGFFEYGGSSIVVLTKGKHELSMDIRERYTVGTEIPVVIGENLINI